MVCTFSVIQPKALSAYKNIAFENLKLSNEKISRQMVCTFSVVQPKALSAYKNIAFENLKLSNEKISRQKVCTFSVVQVYKSICVKTARILC